LLNTDELKLWEEEQMALIHGRYCTKKSDRLFDPCEERLFKRRTRSWGAGYIESPQNRKKWQRHIRTKFKNIDEDSYHPTTHEYWTHGWLTW
jgi:hypothetical protein